MVSTSTVRAYSMLMLYSFKVGGDEPTQPPEIGWLGFTYSVLFGRNQIRTVEIVRKFFHLK
jgi:hypothetical protein